MFGRNPLVIYLFSELFVVTLQQIQAAPDRRALRLDREKVLQAAVPGPLSALLVGIAYTLVCWLLGYVL